MTTRAFTPGVNRPEREFDHSLSSSARLSNRDTVFPPSPTSSWRGTSLNTGTRRNFEVTVKLNNMTEITKLGMRVWFASRNILCSRATAQDTALWTAHTVRKVPVLTPTDLLYSPQLEFRSTNMPPCHPVCLNPSSRKRKTVVLVPLLVPEAVVIVVVEIW